MAYRRMAESKTRGRWSLLETLLNHIFEKEFGVRRSSSRGEHMPRADNAAAETATGGASGTLISGEPPRSRVHRVSFGRKIGPKFEIWEPRAGNADAGGNAGILRANDGGVPPAQGDKTGDGSERTRNKAGTVQAPPPAQKNCNFAGGRGAETLPVCATRSKLPNHLHKNDETMNAPCAPAIRPSPPENKNVVGTPSVP